MRDFVTDGETLAVRWRALLRLEPGMASPQAVSLAERALLVFHDGRGEVRCVVAEMCPACARSRRHAAEWQAGRGVRCAGCGAWQTDDGDGGPIGLPVMVVDGEVYVYLSDE